MKSTLIIYSTTDGHTIKICEKIQEHIDCDNCELIPINKVNKSYLEKFERIIIGASIRYGKHKDELYNFILNNLDVISNKDNAFFSVNVVARKPGKNTPKTNPYMQKFLLKTPWKPKNLGVFAGKIDYPKYKFFDKNMIRFIMWITKGPTNINNSYEFTNWDEVINFAKKIIR